MTASASSPCIRVLAGVNGAGKSSIGGAALRRSSAEYYNPDEAAREILKGTPNLSPAEANGLAWSEGMRLLRRSIDEGLDYCFETTLGGDTITGLLILAAARGVDLRIWYVGLQGVEEHLARVAARVARGGHDIPEADIRRRYDASRTNLIRLLPSLKELKLYDNSEPADPAAGVAPHPRLLMHLLDGHLSGSADLIHTPEWAKPIVMAALERGQA